jgi:hypothetical protein
LAVVEEVRDNGNAVSTSLVTVELIRWVLDHTTVTSCIDRLCSKQRLDLMYCVSGTEGI